MHFNGHFYITHAHVHHFRYNYYMGIFSITFLLLSYQLTSYFGPVGFILANCTNMLLRIIYSGIFIRKQYQSVQLRPLYGIIPKKLFAICLIVFGILCKISEVRLMHTIE